MSTKAVWEGEEGHRYVRALTFDGSFIYAGLATDPPQVVQIDTSDMSTRATWTGDAGEGGAVALAFDGSFLYVGLDSYPSKVAQVRLEDLTERATWVGSGGHQWLEALAFDGEHLYAGLATDPSQVVKIRPSDMTQVSIWTGQLEEAELRALTFDGLYLYIGCRTRPARIIKLIMRDYLPWSDALQAALALLGNTQNGLFIYVMILARDIVLEWNPDPSVNWNYWSSPANKIVLTQNLKGSPPEVIAPHIAHEGYHAFVNVCDSIDQEYHAFEIEALVWQELKNGLTDPVLDSILAIYLQGEEYFKDVLRANPVYAELPEYCP